MKTRGTSLKVVVTDILREKFKTAPSIKGSKRSKALLAALSKGRNTKAIGRLSRQEIYDRP